uniref:Sodium/hydrogen exchanger n=1 Tax=Globodera pallida TaxID=36090 RepID=A0A183BZH2_GLOPA
MLFLKYLFFVGSVILLNWSDVKPLPCSTCPKQNVAEASESSSCGASEECDGSTPSSTTATATTTTAKSNSSLEEGDESGTVQTAILAIAIRTLTNGSSEERCSTSDCSSNGICFGHRLKPLCLCYKGFCGILCKQAVCPGHRGCNGHGWCLATSDSAKCLCQPDYGGKHSPQFVPMPLDSVARVAIVLSLFLSVVLAKPNLENILNTSPIRNRNNSADQSEQVEVDGEAENSSPVDGEVRSKPTRPQSAGESGHTFDINSDEEEQRLTHFQIVSLNWHHVETPYTVSVWILLASIAKILFHVHKRFGEAIPDSALLIVVGLVLGYALHQLHVSIELYNLKSTIFFLYLLPPIIFDAGYFMPSRQLFENWESVMLFAIVGTIWNTLSIGLTLHILGYLRLFSVPFSLFEILLFASLISAVDPVAVIAVFEEVHVNEFLFIHVFGEALFNDGVSVVSEYWTNLDFEWQKSDLLALADYLAGIGSFVVISLGGTFIGLLFAFLVSILTRFTGRVKTLAPVFIFVVPYLSYLTAEMFGLSAILAIVACGIAMKQYVKGNMTHDANSSVKYFVKMLSQCSETAIFMFLGLSSIASKHHWDTLFVSVTIVLCFVYRVIGVLVQCAFLNRFRKKKFSFTDQFVLSYGGLRGAIAFGLVVSLPAVIEAKQMFVTTCIAVIYFTVFLQGITIRPLLFLLKVEKQDMDYEQMMVEKVYNKYFDYTMAGIEDIVGQKGKHFFRDAFERFNANVLKPLLMRNVTRKTFDATDIVRAYNKITLQEALKIAQIGRKMIKAEHKPHTVSITSAYHDTMASGDGVHMLTLRGKDFGQYLMNQENTEMLYAIFSRLLDRKIEEMRRMQETRKSSDDDDIKQKEQREKGREAGGAAEETLETQSDTTERQVSRWRTTQSTTLAEVGVEESRT